MSEISSSSPETVEIHAEVGTNHDDDVKISDYEAFLPDNDVGDKQIQEQIDKHEKLEASLLEM